MEGLVTMIEGEDTSRVRGLSQDRAAWERRLAVGSAIALTGMLGLTAWVALPLVPAARPGLFVLVLLVVGVAGLMAMLADDALRAVVAQPRVLVPVMTGATVATALSSVLNELFAPALAAARAGLVATPWEGLVLLGHLGLMILLLDVLHGTWLARLTGDVVDGSEAKPLAALVATAPRLGRVLLFRGIGFLPLAFMLPVLAAQSTAAQLVAGAALVAGAFIWNLATAAVVPVLLDTPGPFGAVLRHGMLRSWEERRRLWPLVMVQMMLLAGLALARLTAGDVPVRELARRLAFDFALKGGHAHGAHWYDSFGGLSLSSHLPLANLLAWILVGSLAVVARLHTWQVLRSR